MSATKGAKAATLLMPITGANGSTITITAISRGGAGANTWDLPAGPFAISGDSASGVVLCNNNASGTYTAT